MQGTELWGAGCGCSLNVCMSSEFVGYMCR